VASIDALNKAQYWRIKKFTPPQKRTTQLCFSEEATQVEISKKCFAIKIDTLY
jgi:hypothetical protein